MSSSDAAMPSTASALRSQSRRSGALMKEGKRKGAEVSAPSVRWPLFPLFPGFDLLQLGVELVEDLLGVGQLGARLLDPVLDDRAAALVRLGDHRGACLLDVGAGPLERVEPDLVGGIPGLAVRARGVLAGELVDDVLVLLGDLRPLVLVHEEPERGAVQAA